MQLEEDVKRVKYARMKSPDKPDKPGSNNMTTLPVRSEDHVRKTNQDKRIVTSSPVKSARTKEKNHEKEKNSKEKEKQQETPRKQTSWADEMENELAEAAKKCCDKTRENTENIDWFDEHPKERIQEQRTEKTNKEHLKHWVGDENTDSEESSEASTSDSEGEEDENNWDQVDRRAKNKMKKKAKKDKMKKKAAETATKARDIITMGPITRNDVETQRKPGTDFEQAKIAAVRQFLRKQLKYNKEEQDELVIIATKSAKDDFIHVAVKNHDMIRDMFARKADCKNDKIQLKPYIPPQFFQRFCTMSRICKEKRSENQELRTQLRFGLKDIEILTKIRGGEEPFRTVKIEDFMKDEEIPEFDPKIKWRFLQDRPPRRRVTSSPACSPITSPQTTPTKSTTPSTRQDTREKKQNSSRDNTEDRMQMSTEDMNSPASQKTSLVRQRSLESESSGHKKPKTTALIEVNEDGSFSTPLGIHNISDIL